MRILALASKHSGVSYHRIILPLVNMQKDYCLITDVLNEEVLEKGFDILVLNRLIPNSVEQLQEWRKKYGFKIIVDNDDYWDLPPTHQLYERYEHSNIPEKIKSFIWIADACTVTHERLADQVSKINKNVYILPNALPYGQEQFGEHKIESDKVRLFWSGSGTHEHDIKILKEPIKRLVGSDVKMVIAGYNEVEKDIWNNMVFYYTAGRRIENTIYRYNEVIRYMEAYADSDISLIPLQNNTFNSMKSNLKVLETAAKKNPAIVSEVNPYLNLPVFYVRNQTDWFKHIKNLTNDKQMREESGLKLYEYCEKHFNFHAINSNRFNIYSKIIV
jgi:hypothetical protein